MRFTSTAISCARLAATLVFTSSAAFGMKCRPCDARGYHRQRARTTVAGYWAIFELPADVEPGLDAVKLAQNRIDAFAARWRDCYPAAVRALLKDRDSLTVYLRFPREHWQRVRHSNFIVIWSSFEGVFDVRHGASGCRVLRSGRGYLQSSRRQSLRRDDASCTSHLTGLVA